MLKYSKEILYKSYDNQNELIKLYFKPSAGFTQIID